LFAGAISVIFHSLFKNIRLGKKRVVKRRRRKRKKVGPHSLPNSIHATPIDKPEKINDENQDSTNDEHEYEEEILIEDENGLKFHDDDEIIEVEVKETGIVDKFRNLTTDTKVVIILATFGIIGTIISSVLSVVLQENPTFNLVVKIYIGVMVLAMGIIILSLRNRRFKLSMKRIVGLGVIAGFNKGISGGGYGPITVSGQLLAGREGRNAIASTSLSETATCFVGVMAYIITHVVMNYTQHVPVDWDFLNLAPYLVIGAILATPLAALVTNKVDTKWLKIGVGYATIFLGLFSLTKLILDEAGVWDAIPNFVELYLTHLMI
ncbi:MAG: sulfite exporter TauE/SafE family protein, partial [Candidatus Heimdallarchaeota archaeon]